MKRILAMFIFFAMFVVFVVSHNSFLGREDYVNQTANCSDFFANRTSNREFQFLYFRVYHLANGRPIESYPHGQKDVFPFMRKFDLNDDNLVVYSNVNGCEALVGTLGSLCCLNESSRWCNFSFGVESLYGINYGVSKFLVTKNYSLNLSFVWNGEKILLYHANKMYPLKFGRGLLQLNESLAWIYIDGELRVMKVKPYVEIGYLEIESNCTKLQAKL